MNVVLDANLLIVLVNQDTRSSIVRQKIDNWIDAEVQLHAPKLARYEIANALTRLIISGIFPQQDLESAWNFLNDLPVVYHDISQATRIVEIALTLGRKSAYDAAYIALAERLEAQLWTLDSPLYRNAVNCGFPVFLLDNSN